MITSTLYSFCIFISFNSSSWDFSVSVPCLCGTVLANPTSLCRCISLTDSTVERVKSTFLLSTLPADMRNQSSGAFFPNCCLLCVELPGDATVILKAKNENCILILLEAKWFTEPVTSVTFGVRSGLIPMGLPVTQVKRPFIC